MSNRTYPRVVGFNRLPTVPVCIVCGQVAKWERTVEVSYMRGDDLVVTVCEDHKRSDAEIAKAATEAPHA